MATGTARFAKFSRVCIAKEVGSDFPDSVDIITYCGEVCTVHYEYSWPPRACDTCNVFGHSGSNCPSKKHEKPEKNRYKHDSFKIKKPYVNQKQKFREKACMPKPAFKKGSTSGINVQENSEVCSSGAMVSFCVAEIDHCQWALIPFS